jgi:antitoxin component of RelBE/YafQ-DinJ toxin-antitoxin module
MKPPRIFFALLILFFSFQVCGAQEKPETELVESFGAIECEGILSRLDNFLITIRDEPGANGYVIFHEGSDPIQNSTYERAVRSHFRMRRFDQNRYQVITGNPLPEIKVELWLGRNGAKPPVEERKLSLVLNRAAEPYLFAADAVEVLEIEGRLTYLTYGCDVCCIDAANLNLLSEFLEANPGMRADVRVYSRTKTRADQFIRLFLKEVSEDSKIPLNRLKIRYAGVNKETLQLHKKLSTVKIWLVSQRKAEKR